MRSLTPPTLHPARPPLRIDLFKGAMRCWATIGVRAESWNVITLETNSTTGAPGLGMWVGTADAAAARRRRVAPGHSVPACPPPPSVPHPTLIHSSTPSPLPSTGITTSIVTPTSCTDIYVGEVISITIFPTALFLAGAHLLLLLLLLQAR